MRSTEIKFPPGKQETWVFLLLPGFPLLALTGAIEVLRHANRFSGESRFKTAVVSVDGLPVTASNGVQTLPDAALADIRTPAAIAVVAGFDAERINDPC